MLYTCLDHDGLEITYGIDQSPIVNSPTRTNFSQVVLIPVTDINRIRYFQEGRK